MAINHGLLLGSCVQGVGNADSIDQGQGQKCSPFIKKKKGVNSTPDYHKKIQRSTKFQNSKSQNNI